ncbi:hypothetical protein AB0M46_31420 [Dactylosporangium sp. NPDC051485]|uniref:hypothetical protein n=1 Tax=Dactylosporangium sp. NPDC051485 TaxID=3154846 RepID=UPI0034378320
MPAAQRTAWDAYLTVTRGLLPAMDGRPDHMATATCDLSGFVVRIERYAPLWGEQGPILLAALHGAQTLRRGGDRADLADLLRAIADRLYLISAGPRAPRRDRRCCPRNVGAYRTAAARRRGDSDG